MGIRINDRRPKAFVPREFKSTLGILFASFIFLSTGLPSTEGASATTAISETDKLSFTQKDVEAQMQELQDRMFRLADLTKAAEPDNATRLLLAVRKAREQLLIEQMSEILEKLSAKDLSDASAETKDVIVKLNELKGLLIATDLELQLQLERLRQLQAAIRAVDEAIKVEKQQQLQSAGLASAMKSGAATQPAALQKAKTDEAANRTRTEGVQESVKALGNLDAASMPLGAASASMSNAEAQLGGGQPGDAGAEQSTATKKLEEARAALEEERQKVLADLSKQVQKVVIQNLQEMLDRQAAVRHSTETLLPRLKTDREAVMRLRQLAAPEERIAGICQDTLNLVNETEFSVALPAALESLEKNMLYVSGDLTGGRGGEQTINTQIAIESDLKDLIDTFKSLNSDGGISRSKGNKGDMNKLLAELKVVRMLQLRVNKGTSDADLEARRSAAAADLPPELREQVTKLRDGEESARHAMDLLHQRFAQ